MAIYSHAARTITVTSGVATWELRTAAGGRAHIREIGIFMAAATASTFGLGRPAAIGVTPTSPVTGLGEDPAEPAGLSSTAVAWATAPTAPTNAYYHRRIGLPAAIGSGVIWTFGLGELVVSISSSIAIYCLATNGVADIYCKWHE
jgi:hypothetical protein